MDTSDRLPPDVVAEARERGIPLDGLGAFSIEPQYVLGAGRYVHPGMDAEPWNARRACVGKLVTLHFPGRKPVVFEMPVASKD